MPIQAKYTSTKGLIQTGKEGYASGAIDLTADITLTSTIKGEARNNKTFQLKTLAAAANAGEAVLVAFTGTKDAVVCTVTPDDAPLTITTAEVAELINTGSVSGKAVTVTDDSNLRRLQTASGGGADDLANGGEGSDKTATFLGAPEAEFHVKGVGVSSDLQEIRHQVLTLTTVADSATLFKSTIKLSTPTDLFTLFFNRAAPNNVAIPAGAVNVELSANGADDSDAVATALEAVIEALGGGGGAFSSSAAGSVVTVKSETAGVASSPDMGTSGITFATTSAGSGSTVLKTTGVTILNSTYDKAAALTLGNLTSSQAGTLKTIHRTDGGTANQDVTVAKHVAADDQVLRFNLQNEFACLVWLGDKWGNVGASAGVVI